MFTLLAISTKDGWQIILHIAINSNTQDKVIIINFDWFLFC